MATNFAFTNDTVRASQTTQEYSLGLTTNYAIVEDEPNQVLLDNTTAPLDQQELITFRKKNVNTVNSGLNVQNPNPIKGGVQYAVQIEEVLRQTLGDSTIVDHPCVMYLTVRHDKSGVFTNAVLAEVLERLLSSLRKEGDNTYRFSDLQRGALRPSVS